MAESIDDRINDVMKIAKEDGVSVGIHLNIHSSPKNTKIATEMGSWHIVACDIDDAGKSFSEGAVGTNPMRAYNEALRRLRYQQEVKA
jgi:hypothetical protein